jgi:chromosome segregation ATPase
MAPLLKNLLGSSSKDREQIAELRSLLHELQQERARGEALIASARESSERLQTLGAPIAQAGTDVDAVNTRIAELEQRFGAMVQLVPKFESMHERLGGLVEGQHRAEAQVVQALEEAKLICASFDEIGAKVQQAVSLQDRLEKFLEIEKPFQQVRDEVGALRGQVEGTGDHLARLREQHDRLLDAHKLATTKMEALDRRREELSRDLQDKERRVASVANAVRGLDGVQQNVDDLKRQIGTLKALGDFVSQKSAALEAQREAVEVALARAENLDRAVRQIDAGVRQQQQNESALTALQDEVAALQALHVSVVERSREITQLQRDTDEQAREMRLDLATAQDEMKKSVERFDFESRGLESVSQRVTDVRGALSDFELRFKNLAAASQTVAGLATHTQSLAGQVGSLSAEVARIGEEATKLQGIRRELDDLSRIALDAGTKVARIEEARPAVEAALRDFEQLRGAHALVHDALEQTGIAHGEISRFRENQSETRTWLAGVEESVDGLKAQVEELQGMRPLVDRAQRQTQAIGESMDLIQSRQAFVEELRQRLTTLVALGEDVDERGRRLTARMEAAEQRFTSLSALADEAERTAMTVAEISSGLGAAQRGAADVSRKIAEVETRCESVEALAAGTQTLKQELDQRHAALEAAKQDLKRASGLRQDAATSAQKLEELAKHLGAALAAAEGRATQLDGLASQLEHRASDLKPVEQRLDRFEERLTTWNLVEQDVARSLEQLSSRQGTVDALQADLERMFAMAEKTAIEVREITSAQREVEDSRKLLDSVMKRLSDVRDLASALDERKRQMGKAEERLARTEALLVDVQSSLEVLQGQKVLVDQAVEKAGSLQALVRQADATAASLREDREMLGRMRAAVGVEREDDEVVDDDEEPLARAA